MARACLGATLSAGASACSESPCSTGSLSAGSPASSEANKASLSAHLPTHYLSAGALACSGSPCSTGSYGIAGMTRTCTLHTYHTRDDDAKQRRRAGRRWNVKSCVPMMLSRNSCVLWAGATRSSDELCSPCQAGSFSAITGQAFFTTRKRDFEGGRDENDRLGSQYE